MWIFGRAFKQFWLYYWRKKFKYNITFLSKFYWLLQSDQTGLGPLLSIKSKKNRPFCCYFVLWKQGTKVTTVKLSLLKYSLLKSLKCFHCPLNISFIGSLVCPLLTYTHLFIEISVILHQASLTRISSKVIDVWLILKFN